MKHASELTAAQIVEAKKLYISYFGNSENPAALAALIQTLALNYATTVAQKI